MVGRTKATEALRELERAAETNEAAEIAKSLWMAESSYRALKRFVEALPSDEETTRAEVFVSCKWETGAHVGWVRTLAADLRARGVNAILSISGSETRRVICHVYGQSHREGGRNSVCDLAPSGGVGGSG